MTHQHPQPACHELADVHTWLHQLPHTQPRLPGLSSLIHLILPFLMPQLLQIQVRLLGFIQLQSKEKQIFQMQPWSVIYENPGVYENVINQLTTTSS